jgi:archaellum component FlaC
MIDHKDIQIKKLEDEVRRIDARITQLEMTIKLLTDDMNTIKFEGCWRFIDDPSHQHKK